MKKTRNGMRITGLLLTMVMLVALLGAFSLTASAAEGTAIDLSSLTETYVISNSGEYIFTGSGCYGIKVASGNPMIVLNDASITVGEGSAIDVASGSNATIFVLGDNSIGTTNTESWDAPCGGIFVAEGGTVNITSNGTDNILRAHGTLAAAIGGKYDYDNNESYNAGSINISNVTVYAYTNNFYASAIGAAGEGTCGTINITNAVVYVYGAGDEWTSAPGIGNAWSLLDWSDTIPIVIISNSEVHTFRYNPYSDYIGYLGDESGDTYATGSINCGDGGSVKNSTIYCYTGLDATTTDKVVKYGALGGLLKEDGTCEGEHSGGTQTCMGYKCANCANWYGEKNDTHDWSGKVGICANGCGMTCDHSNATYPADGITDTQHKLVCSECGYEVTETHDFVNGECVCSLKNFHIYGQQLNIGGDLSMKYYVTAFGDGVSTETLKMKFIFLGKETFVSGIYNAEMGMYVFALEGINPQCMGDKIDAYLILDGKEKASKLSYTVEENLLALREKYKDDTALVTLVNDILAYGSAASEYKGYGSMTDDYVSSDREIPTTNVAPSDAFTGYTVTFGQMNYIKIRVNLADGNTLYLGETDITNELVDGVYKTAGIAPTDFYKVFTFTVKNGEETVATFALSVNDYISANKDSESMGNLVKALYNYGVSAEEYARPIINLTQYADGETIDITQSSKIIGDGTEYNLSLNIAEDVTVVFDEGTGGVKLNAITVADNKTLTLQVKGNVEHIVKEGISIGNGSNVIIEGERDKENNKLTVTATDGNAAIGANNGVTAGDITIRNARVEATGSSTIEEYSESPVSGAAIGTSDANMGDILIENSIITATGSAHSTLLSFAAAIGSGSFCESIGNIVFVDSEITAKITDESLASVIGAGCRMHGEKGLVGTMGDIVFTNTSLNLSIVQNLLSYGALIGNAEMTSYFTVNMGKIIFTDMTQAELDAMIATWTYPEDFAEWGAYIIGRSPYNIVDEKGTIDGVYVSDGNGGTVKIGNADGYNPTGYVTNWGWQ